MNFFKDSPVDLMFFSMCNKFDLACMIMSRMSGSFYIVCWYGNVDQKLAYNFSKTFYYECQIGKFDVEHAFNVAANMCKHNRADSGEIFPCLMCKSESGEKVLLQANWRTDTFPSLRPELEQFDRWIINEFEEHTARYCDSEFVSSSQILHIEEEDRDWLEYEGNIQGNNEKLALEAIGFTMTINGRVIGKKYNEKTADGKFIKGHMLSDKKIVEGKNIDLFWKAQKFNKSIWPSHPKHGRKWTGKFGLWESVVPNIIKQVNLSRKEMVLCKMYLYEVAAERQRMLKSGPGLNSHAHMLEIIQNIIDEIELRTIDQCNDAELLFDDRREKLDAIHSRWLTLHQKMPIKKACDNFDLWISIDKKQDGKYPDVIRVRNSITQACEKIDQRFTDLTEASVKNCSDMQRLTDYKSRYDEEYQRGLNQIDWLHSKSAYYGYDKVISTWENFENAIDGARNMIVQRIDELKSSQLSELDMSALADALPTPSPAATGNKKP